MTEHSIPFSPSMVEALRKRRKTQTRRLVSTHNTTFDSGPWPDKSLDLSGAWLDESFPTSPILKVKQGGERTFETIHRLRPRVEIGDSLWVKEAHWALGHWLETGESKKNGKPKWAFVRSLSEPIQFDQPEFFKRFPRDTTFGWYPRNSLFMGKTDSRTTLNVTDVRLHRIAEITAGDSIAEGVECETCVAMGTSQCFYYGCFASIDAFRQLITSINGPEMWEENRFVLAYSFGVDHRNISEVAE